MKEDLKRVKAVPPDKLVVLGMNTRDPEQLAPESGPLETADVLVREDPDDEGEEDEDAEEEDDEKEDEGYSE